MTGTQLIDRAVIRLAGEDVRGFLQGLITNDVQGDLPVWAGLLTPQGKALFDFLVWADSDDLLIDCEAEQASALVRRLSLYRLRRPISIAIAPDYAVHWCIGELSEGARRHKIDLGPLPWIDCPDPRNPALGHRWISAPTDQPAVGWLAHRLSLEVVEGVAELGSDKTLWLECNALAQNGVSFTKGCYVGQENTARMHHRQKVNRRLGVVVAQDDPGEAARIWYPALKLAVVHQRIA